MRNGAMLNGASTARSIITSAGTVRPGSGPRPKPPPREQLPMRTDIEKELDMKIRAWLEKRRTLIGRLRELQQTIGGLTETISEMQTSFKDRISTTANPYQTLNAQVDEIVSKWNGESDWGCELLQRLVNVLAAFTLPNGLDLVTADNFEGDANDKGQAEHDYLEKWLDDNNLNEGGTLKLVQEAHLQGQIVLTLKWKKAVPGSDDEGKVICSYQSWQDTGFVVEAVDSNLVGPYKLKYTPEGSETEITIPDARFVWLAINARYGKTEGRPRLGTILHILEFLSMELTDWRKSNEIFGHPTPYFKCKDATEVKQVKAELDSIRWKLGKALAGTADLSLVVPAGSAAESKELITILVQIISATTGVWPHFLGFPNLMSNRATAESMGEPSEIVSKSEMASWRAFFDSLFDKVIRLRNDSVTNQTELREGVIKTKLLPLTDRQWKQIEKVWLPMLKEGAISLPTFLARIPNLDVEAEIEKLKTPGIKIESEEEL